MDKTNPVKTLLVLAICGCSSQVFGAAFQLNEHSATGLGRSFAGEGAIADNASIIARNPAGMALFDQAQVSVAGSFINPDINVVGENEINNANNIAPSAAIPAFYYLHPYSDRLAFGVGTFSNYGLSTKFKENYNLGSIAGQTKLVTLNFNPSVSYRVNSMWSIGAGLNAVFAKAELIRHSGLLSAGLSSAVTDRTAYLKGDDWGHGWNIGTLIEFTPEHRLGLTYRSQVKIDFQGDYTNDISTAVNTATLTGKGSVLEPGSLKLELPSIMEISGYHRFQPQWAMHYSLMRVGWSSFDELRAVDTSGRNLFQKDEKFRNSWRYSLGGTYYGFDQWELRAGLTYDDSPIPDEYKSISIPDADRFWYSFGGSYKLKENQSIDLGVTYIKATKDQKFVEQVSTSTSATVTTKSEAYLFALQWNMTF